jgi:hypothetical protein
MEPKSNAENAGNAEIRAGPPAAVGDSHVDELVNCFI